MSTNDSQRPPVAGDVSASTIRAVVWRRQINSALQVAEEYAEGLQIKQGLRVCRVQKNVPCPCAYTQTEARLSLAV